MLKEYSVVVEQALQWAEMDAFQHVNNIVYFRFFENARIAYFYKTEFINEIKKSPVGPILKSTSCNFRFPLVFPDTISIGAKTIELKIDRFLMHYAIFSHRHQRTVAEGEGMVVSFDYQKGEKAPLPPTVLEAIQKLDSIELSI